MEFDPYAKAWNKLVMNADPHIYAAGDARRAAAIAVRYMSAANSGGLNGFLTSSYDLDASEVLSAFRDIGADVAADQLQRLLALLSEPLPVATQSERWDLLDRVWTRQIDRSFEDSLSVEADEDLASALDRHLREHFDCYQSLTDPWQPPERQRTLWSKLRDWLARR